MWNLHIALYFCIKKWNLKFGISYWGIIVVIKCKGTLARVLCKADQFVFKKGPKIFYNFQNSIWGVTEMLLHTIVKCRLIQPNLVKSKITKKLNSEENSKRKTPNQMAKSELKHFKRMNDNGHILDLVQTFSNVEKGELNLTAS